MGTAADGMEKEKPAQAVGYLPSSSSPSGALSPEPSSRLGTALNSSSPGARTSALPVGGHFSAALLRLVTPCPHTSCSCSHSDATWPQLGLAPYPLSPSHGYKY